MKDVNECGHKENLLADFKKTAANDCWKIGNDILYRMCRDYPHHNNESEIIAKFWLIGRAYAASLERNKNRKKKISDDFFKEELAPKIKDGLDLILLDIKSVNSLNKETIPIVLKTHKDVMDFIHEEITGNYSRSFVSKYLHFHFPQLFFIYDSRAASVIHGVVSEYGKYGLSFLRDEFADILNDTDTKYDSPYANFFVKCFSLSDFLSRENSSASPREIDSYLIKVANGDIGIISPIKQTEKIMVNP